MGSHEGLPSLPRIETFGVDGIEDTTTAVLGFWVIVLWRTSQDMASHASVAWCSILRIIATLRPEREPIDGA